MATKTADIALAVGDAVKHRFDRGYGAARNRIACIDAG
jgi:hypothetical protein